jgi:hypothetical protein
MISDRVTDRIGVLVYSGSNKVEQAYPSKEFLSLPSAVFLL